MIQVIVIQIENIIWKINNNDDDDDNGDVKEKKKIKRSRWIC